MVKNLFTIVLLLASQTALATPFEECAVSNTFGFLESIEGPFSPRDIAGLEYVVLSGCLESLGLENDPGFDQAAAALKVKEIVRKALGER